MLNPDLITDTVQSLQNRGYILKFRREATCISCIGSDQLITPEFFMVDEYYHFEDTDHPDRDRTLYAISSLDGLKGFLIDTCFVYEDNISIEMMQKLQLEYTLDEYKLHLKTKTQVV
ncbi:MAG: phosphoribosylpyrophosphate synthetase [Sphingobacteriales bacterium]|nr:MAG: phosphoribosylpyrophosphate synthetase [Sphingobacteriales bacterium]